MAFKKKSSEGKSKQKLSMSDVRVFAVVFFLAFVALVALIVTGVQSTKATAAQIEKVKETYQQNQVAIANLKALQKQSSVYEAQQAEYTAMIPETQDLQEIMIEMENRIEKSGCTLMEITFPEATEGEGTTTSGLHEQIVQISMKGKYEDLLQLMTDLTQSAEFMRIDNIELTPESEGKMNAQITLVKFSKR